MRIGKFTITDQVLPYLQDIIFQDMVVLEKYFSQRLGDTDYVAECPEFADIQTGEIIPWYEISILVGPTRLIRRIEHERLEHYKAV